VTRKTAKEIFEEKTNKKFDPVNNPPHYTLRDGIECIDYIEQTLTKVEFKGFCHGNLLKYQHRHRDKGNPIEDMEKAKWYLEKMIETMKELRK
tara:strand:+ start:49 stop:327 length:279 start_codon:yes stop_codon:yes gene_type:complete